MPIPIGLTGLAGAGKDTAFSYLREWADERGVSARRRSFADALKLSFARMFLPDCSVDEAVMWCNEIKFTGDLFIEWSNDGTNGTKTTIEHRISGRTALQRYGTEGHRDVFGSNFWVDVLFPTATVMNEYDLPDHPQYVHNFMGPLDQGYPEICVAADTRFPNEAERIKLLKGFVLEIVRIGSGGFDMQGQIEGQHSSEAGVPRELIDHTIMNDGSLEELRERVFAWADSAMPQYEAEQYQ